MAHKVTHHWWDMTSWNRIIFGVFLLLISGCASMGQPSSLRHAFREEVGEGRKLLQTGHYREAVDELSMLLEMDSDNGEALLARAAAYQHLEAFEPAVQDYERVLKKDPDSAKAHYNLGMIYAYKLNDPARALDHFDRFLTADPRSPRAFSAAKIMCSIDSEDSSEDSALKEDVRRALEERDPDKKREVLREVSKKYAASPLPLYLIAKSYEFEGKRDEAIRAYKQALAIRPTCGPCHQALGKLLIRLKARDEGETHLLKAELFDPNETGSDSPETF